MDAFSSLQALAGPAESPRSVAVEIYLLRVGQLGVRLQTDYRETKTFGEGSKVSKFPRSRVYRKLMPRTAVYGYP